jgi:hypothetical protein
MDQILFVSDHFARRKSARSTSESSSGLRAAKRGSCPRPVIVQSEQRNYLGDIALVANEITDPSGVRKYMMRLSLPCGNEVFADEQGKGEIRQPAAMQMA